MLISELLFTGITPLPAGEAQIKVTFDIGTNSDLSVTIKDIKSGVEQRFFLNTPVFHLLPVDNTVMGELTKVTINDTTESQLSLSKNSRINT